MIALCDCNKFYASCERLFRPDLKGKGILVLSNNDGIVVALNKEAQDKGYKRGDVYHKIAREAQDKGCHFFSSNYALYANLSNRVMNFLSENTEEVIPYSIDEAFFLPKTDQNISDLQKKLYKEIGLPISIGVARTKTLAKIANNMGKESKTNVEIITEEKEKDVLKDIRIEDVWGIGYQTAKKLKKKGIYTALSFSQLDESFVKKNFNITILNTQRELNGLECIREDTSEKSYCSGISFKNDITSFDELYKALCAQAQILSIKLEEHNKTACAFSVSIFTSRFLDNYYAPFKEIVFEEQTNYLPSIMKAIYPALKEIYKPHRYKGCRLFAFSLIDKNIKQYSLFQSKEEIQTLKERAELNDTVYEINKKYGRKMIVPATILDRDKKSLCRREFLSPSYTTSFEELKQID